MDTVPATGTVRRTVRVAVALVVGHALLGALIGWLTFGFVPAPGPRSAAPAVDRLGAPPPSSVPPGRLPPRNVAVTARRLRPATREADARRGTPGTPAPAPVTTSPAAPDPAFRMPDTPSSAPTPPAPAPPAASAIPTPSGSAPASATPSATPAGPVTVGDPCWPEGTTGHTADGVPVRCERVAGQGPLWAIF